VQSREFFPVLEIGELRDSPSAVPISEELIPEQFGLARKLLDNKPPPASGLVLVGELTGVAEVGELLAPA
jgi:hypothetical protein